VYEYVDGTFEFSYIHKQHSIDVKDVWHVVIIFVPLLSLNLSNTKHFIIFVFQVK